MKSSMLILVVACATAGLVGCAATPKPVSGAADIVAQDGPPPSGARRMETIQVTHGRGCGFAGFLGSEEGALALARNKAAELGGDYVQVTGRKTPYSDGQCRHNEYIITAVVYSTKPETESTAVATGAGDAQASTTPLEKKAVPLAPGVEKEAPDKWDYLKFPATEFYSKEFSLTNGRYRYAVQQVDPKKNFYGQSEIGQELLLLSVHETDVDADGVSEVWLILRQGDFNIFHGNSPSEPRPAAVFVFRVGPGVDPQYLDTVYSEEGEIYWRDAQLQSWSGPDEARVLSKWSLKDGRLVNANQLVKPAPVVYTKKHLTRQDLEALLGQRLGPELQPDRPITPALIKVMGKKKFEDLQMRLGVSGESKLIDGYVVGFGITPHRGGAEESCYAFGLENLDLHVVLRYGEKFERYSSVGRPPKLMADLCSQTDQEVRKFLAPAKAKHSRLTQGFTAEQAQEVLEGDGWKLSPWKHDTGGDGVLRISRTYVEHRDDYWKQIGSVTLVVIEYTSARAASAAYAEFVKNDWMNNGKEFLFGDTILKVLSRDSREGRLGRLFGAKSD